MRTQVVVWALLLAAGAAAAADWKALQATYAVTARSYLDPADGEPLDSHLRIQLEGAAAEDLYRAMKVSAVVDVCTGALEKTVGEMRCQHFESADKYQCNFAIDIMQQKIEYGIAC